MELTRQLLFSMSTVRSDPPPAEPHAYDSLSIKLSKYLCIQHSDLLCRCI